MFKFMQLSLSHLFCLVCPVIVYFLLDSSCVFGPCVYVLVSLKSLSIHHVCVSAPIMFSLCVLMSMSHLQFPFSSVCIYNVRIPRQFVMLSLCVLDCHVSCVHLSSFILKRFIVFSSTSPVASLCSFHPAVSTYICPDHILCVLESAFIPWLIVCYPAMLTPCFPGFHVLMPSLHGSCFHIHFQGFLCLSLVHPV